MLDNTVMIITSDHGEEFGEHNNYEHGHSLYNELLHVPLIISGPGISPATITAPVRLLDILPTVQHLTGTKSNVVQGQGENLLPLTKKTTPARELPVLATGILYGRDRWVCDRLKSPEPFRINFRRP